METVYFGNLRRIKGFETCFGRAIRRCCKLLSRNTKIFWSIFECCLKSLLKSWNSLSLAVKHAFNRMKSWAILRDSFYLLRFLFLHDLCIHLKTLLRGYNKTQNLSEISCRKWQECCRHSSSPKNAIKFQFKISLGRAAVAQKYSTSRFITSQCPCPLVENNNFSLTNIISHSLIVLSSQRPRAAAAACRWSSFINFLLPLLK